MLVDLRRERAMVRETRAKWKRAGAEFPSRVELRGQGIPPGVGLVPAGRTGERAPHRLEVPEVEHAPGRAAETGTDVRVGEQEELPLESVGREVVDREVAEQQLQGGAPARVRRGAGQRQRLQALAAELLRRHDPTPTSVPAVGPT